MTDTEIFAQIFEAIKNFGAIPWMLKIASIITIVISLTKVSFLRPLWDKLGWIKGIVAPVLGFVAGILLLSRDGNFTWAGVFAYSFAGAGGIILHELFEGFKAIPGVNGVAVTVIEFIQKMLKAPEPKPEIES